MSLVLTFMVLLVSFDKKVRIKFKVHLKTQDAILLYFIFHQQAKLF